MYEKLYFAEAIIAVAAIGSGILLFVLKRKEGLWKYLLLCIIAFFALFAATFVLEKPVIETKDIYYIEANSGEKIDMPRAWYHFEDISEAVQIKGELSYEKVGEYPIEFVIKTLTGFFSKSATVIVQDTIAPELILAGEEQMVQSYATDFAEPGFQATDLCDGDLTAAVLVEKEESGPESYILHYTVKDFSGNETVRSRTVLLQDDVKPVLTLNGSANMTVYLNEPYVEKGAKAVDEKDGDLTAQIKIEGQVNTAAVGKYTVTYRVTDQQGNEAVATRKVTVKQYLRAQDGSGGIIGTIFLTFDDGPSSNITPAVLDILKQKNVKATFFVINYDAAGELLVRRAFDEGHTVAIHGYSHNYNTIYQSEEAYMENLTKLQEKILATTGYTATITRFPGGSSNLSSSFNPGIMTRLCGLVRERGFTYFDWNVSSGDAGGAKTADAMVNNVIKGLSKSRQNVVLMHDFSSNQKLLSALPRIIDYGIENGYTFDRITENTPMVTHTPKN